MGYKRLPIGVDNFEKMINEELYYVDKTLFIKELLDKRGEVNLFMRPRRFGKSLTISMLQHFFEKGRDGTQLFNGLKIMDAGEKYVSEMNKYPVICISLKTVDYFCYEGAYEKLQEILIKEFERYNYLLESDNISNRQKKKYTEIIDGDGTAVAYSGCLQFLSECLEQHHGKKTIVLIDEYDVPLEKSYFNGYYDEMLKFIRLLFDNVLKSNSSLHFAVLTGCLRISKESIFTGLNNPKMLPITSVLYGEYFGFTEREVKTTLSYYQLEERAREVERWYNGYVFGDIKVFNPWSIINYVDEAISGQKYPKPYWSNTSSNDIIRHLIEVSDSSAKEELERLVSGGSITVPIHEEIVYRDIMQSTVNRVLHNIWNFLFFTGYLTKTGESTQGRQKYFTMAIPNEEVLYIYENQISIWFEEQIKISDTAPFLKAILEGDTDTIEKELNKRLMATISFHDSAENFYHGFLTGILSNIEGYIIKSNRESGSGRSDIFMKTKGVFKRAVIFECKALKDYEDAEEKCIAALKQIEEKHYAYELGEEGYSVIQKYGISFRSKECMVRCSPDLAKSREGKAVIQNNPDQLEDCTSSKQENNR